MTNVLRHTLRADRTTYDLELRSYMVRVFLYISLALMITGTTAYFAFDSGLIRYFYSQSGGIEITGIGWFVVFAPLIIVLFVVPQIGRLSLNTSRLILVLYSGLMGLSLSHIFIVYAAVDITRVFFITASLFLTMSIYGYSTKKDLTSVGAFMMMGLLGIIIASLVNLLLKSAAIYFVTSIISVLIFIGLTAYDVQKLKDNFDHIGYGLDVRERASLIGALILYMDFINLFLSLLNIFGKKKRG